MSRIGYKPIPIPSGVTLTQKGQAVTVKGPKGELKWELPKGISMAEEEGKARFTRSGDSREQRALHGLSRALISNMVTGVSQGFEKKLEVYGVGYSVDLKGKTLVLNLGYCNPQELAVPEGIEVKVDVKAARGNDDPAKLSLSGIDKQVVGQFAAEIRRLRPPEPYKQKGVRYQGEIVPKKVGKPLVSGG